MLESVTDVAMSANRTRTVLERTILPRTVSPRATDPVALGSTGPDSPGEEEAESRSLALWSAVDTGTDAGFECHTR
ncbi:hypothetical protein [Natrinema amylolyticum]|uniref:hypothetical protein n=1 Tax=Natrinema amylolyticum TaxID=2878679 RepID=UPI001CFC2691|nr:hypothetical protein [Natrinema amylolyticum]